MGELTQLSISIPKIIVDKIRELNVDIESYIIEVILQNIKLEFNEELEIHVKLSEKYLRDGKELIDKDPIQASEKLYKAAEEALKVLIMRNNIEKILKKVKERGRWRVDDLFEGVSELRKIFGDDVRRWWSTAWELHVWGFHEAKATKEYVEERIEDIKKFLELTERVIRST